MKTSEAIRSVIGIDLGDRYSYLHELDMQTGETLSQMRLPTVQKRSASTLRPSRRRVSPWRSARIHPEVVACFKTWDIKSSSPIQERWP
jgi:hypothetical protein